jgi:hypothetical protein
MTEAQKEEIPSIGFWQIESLALFLEGVLREDGIERPGITRSIAVMGAHRKFRPEFKRQVVEELLGGINTPAQIIRRY